MTPTDKKLKEVYINLQGLYNLPSLLGSTYMAILIYKKMRKIWLLYLRSKDKFINMFQNWLFRVENKSSYTMKILREDRKRKFIFIKFKVFYKEKDITFKYTVFYMHKENRLIERRQRTIVNMKDSLLLNNSLLLNFWVEVMDTASYLENRLSTKIQRGKLISEEVQTRN